ncbi:MAG: hypothetical protein KBA51_07625 [Kiritimatiellae bacterium]|nr:hypothetical protein [Kiritimatiellia bacterium]
MNNLQDLFLNPITLIGIILALIFIAMGYFRHLGIKHAHEERNRDIKPVVVSNPFSFPNSSAAAHPTSQSPVPQQTKSSPPSERTFRLFGKGGTVQHDKSGYVWE